MRFKVPLCDAWGDRVADERPLPCEVETSPFAFMLATAPASPDNIHPFAACRDERHDPVLDSALLEQNI